MLKRRTLKLILEVAGAAFLALTLAAPALAATPRTAAPATVAHSSTSAAETAHAAKKVHILNAVGRILCDRDLCLQTLSVTGPTGRPPCTAVVRTWPYITNLYGHFELAETFDGIIQNSRGGDHGWRAGIDGYNFTIPYFTGAFTYTGIAWQLNNPPNGHSYSNVGEVKFGISGPVGCQL